MTKQTKVGSGGNGKTVAVGVAAGSRKASAISPADVRTGKPAAAKTITAPAPLGNEVAKNVGAGGPGKGRTVHGSGSQGQH